VLDGAGVATCWGKARLDPVAVPPGETFTRLAAGNYHACGLRPAGTAVCWGNDDHGQLAAPATMFTALTAGYGFTCGLLADGSVECWGERPTSDNGKQVYVPMESRPDDAFTSIEGGAFHVCGIKADTTVTCWGDNSYGQINAP